MRTIEEIILDWKGEFGTLGRGATGPYRYIDYRQKKDLLMGLVQTLIDEGYEADTIQSQSTVNLIVNGCEAPDGASSRSTKSIKKGKQITQTQLKEFVFKEFFRGSVSKHIAEVQNVALPEITLPEPITVPDEPTKEELLEEIMNPKDRLVSSKKIDRSNDINWELLEALGLQPDEAEDE